MAKRAMDLLCALAGLLVLAPLFACIAIWIKLDSPGPVFFRQERVGRHGVVFRIHKFRTMILDAERRGGQLTVGRDSRVTTSGQFLRKYKLDELPQLLDVAAGDMSLVGPRPEVPRFVAAYPEEVRAVVQSVRPGITDWASLHFKDESALLAGASDPEAEYVQHILPIKLKYYVDYVRERSLWMDLEIVFRTISAILLRRTSI